MEKSNMEVKPKVLPLDEALTKALEIFATLQDNDQSFTFQRRRALQQMKFTSVSDCDTVKFYVKEFEIKKDSRADRFAELVIHYETKDEG